MPNIKEAAAEPSNYIYLLKPLILPFKVIEISIRVYRSLYTSSFKFCPSDI